LSRRTADRMSPVAPMTRGVRRSPENSHPRSTAITGFATAPKCCSVGGCSSLPQLKIVGHYERAGAVKIGDTALDSPSEREIARRQGMTREGWRFADTCAAIVDFGAPPDAPIQHWCQWADLLNLPEYTFLIDDGFGNIQAKKMPDPGIPLTDPRPPGVPPPFVRHPAFFAGMFKIPSLWGVRNTAPYFHDNSVKTLEELAAFYADMFANNPDYPVQLTAQDEADMVAYLKLLR
jgi:hypothetical protein